MYVCINTSFNVKICTINMYFYINTDSYGFSLYEMSVEIRK